MGPALMSSECQIPSGWQRRHEAMKRPIPGGGIVLLPFSVSVVTFVTATHENKNQMESP